MDRWESLYNETTPTQPNVDRLIAQRDEAEKELQRVRHILNLRDAELANANDLYDQAIADASIAISNQETLRRERDEAVALLRDVTAIALPYIPKSIKDPRTFTVNLSRAFLSRLDGKAGAQ